MGANEFFQFGGVVVIASHQPGDGGDLVGVDDGGGFFLFGDACSPGGVERSCGLEDVHPQQQVRLTVGDNGGDRLVRNVVDDLADDAAVANGQTLFVQEDDLVSFLVSGADDDASAALFIKLYRTCSKRLTSTSASSISV